jgi:hypothetical protein
MNRICIEKATNKLIEFQSGTAKLGTLVKNAVEAGYKKSKVEEKYTEDDYQTVQLKYETLEEKNKREGKEAKIIVIKDAQKALYDKYKGKKKSDITDADALEFVKLEMARELGLDLQ